MTSDIFNKKRKRTPVLYRASGPGFSLTFPASTLYEEKDAENAAIARAMNLGGKLEQWDPERCRFVLVYSPSRAGGVVLPEIDMNAPIVGVKKISYGG
jgi:hypothetical protein